MAQTICLATIKKVLIGKAAVSLTARLHLLPLALAKPAPACKDSERAGQGGMRCSSACLPPLAPAFSLRVLSAAASSFCFCLNLRSSSSSSLPCFLGACSPGSHGPTRGVVRQHPADNRQACARQLMTCLTFRGLALPAGMQTQHLSRCWQAGRSRQVVSTYSAYLRLCRPWPCKIEL